MRKVILIFALCAVAAVSCRSAKQQSADTTPTNAGKGATDMAMSIMSPAFTDGSAIPKKYSCDGSDLSPPLSWTGVPANAKSLTLIMDDPDAPMGTWVHWVMWNIPPNMTSLPEGISKDGSLSDGSKQGKNSWPKTGYGGPCPPTGKPHRYFFKLYALDTLLTISENANSATLQNAMSGHVIAQAQTMGTYGR